MMKVFLSWSGDISQQIAREVHDWLPIILQNVRPYMTPADIEKGARWGSEITRELETCNFGIICLTKDNLASQWICFEAGALSKAVTGRVASFLFGIGHADVQQPLAQFQGTLFEKADVRKLVADINAACKPDEQLDDRRLERLFEMMWPDFEGKIKLILESAEAAAPSPPPSGEDKVDQALKMISEILVLVREQFALRSSTNALSLLARPFGSYMTPSASGETPLTARAPADKPAQVGQGLGSTTLTPPVQGSGEGLGRKPEE